MMQHTVGLVFSMGGALYAFPNAVIEEISTVTYITPLPLPRREVLGIYDLQGKTFSVWNLQAVLFDDQDIPTPAAPYLIVLTKSQKGFIGWAVTHVHGIQYLSEAEYYASTLLEVYLQYDVIAGVFLFAERPGMMLRLDELLNKIENTVQNDLHIAPNNTNTITK